MRLSLTERGKTVRHTYIHFQTLKTHPETLLNKPNIGEFPFPKCLSFCILLPLTPTPPPRRASRTKTGFRRAKVSQEAWRQGPESWPVDSKRWALRDPAGQARSHLQVFAPAVSSAWPAWPSLLDLWPLDLCPAHSFLLFGLISKVSSSQTTLLSVV